MLLIATGLLFASSSSAATVNVDFQGKQWGSGAPVYSGPGVVGTGTVWNAYNFDGPGSETGTARPPAIMFEDNGSTVSTVSVTFANNNAFHFNSLHWGTSLNWAAGYAHLLGDFVDAGGSGKAVTIGGLVPGAGYDLVLFGGRDGNGSSSFNVLSTIKTTTSLNAPHSLTLGVDYVVYTNVIASALGEIPYRFERVHNGLQISAVPIPEPTSILGLLVIGSTLVLRRRSAI